MQSPTHGLCIATLSIVLSGCSIPIGLFGLGNTGPATIGGYFPAAKDALWVYEESIAFSAESSPSKSLVSFQVDNVSQTNEIAAVSYKVPGMPFNDVTLMQPQRISPEKATIFSVARSEDASYYVEEVIPLPLKKDAAWRAPGMATADVKVTEVAEVTVPAGKFQTLHVVYSVQSSESSRVTKEYWLADGVGAVKGILYGAGFSSSATSTIELSSYHL